MADIFTSDFLWGIIIGLLLTLIGTWWLHERQERIKRLTVARFVEDVIQTISRFVEQLDAERQRNNEVINGDYLSLINGEIELYARNREHLVNIRNPELRAEIKSFLTEVAIKNAKIQSKLNEFYKYWGDAQALDEGEPKQTLITMANSSLEQARIGVDRLMDYMARERITAKLQAIKF